MKNRTLLFGEGLFETFRVYRGGKLAFVEDHLDRMAEGCRFFHLPFSRQKAMDALRGAVRGLCDGAEGRLRLNLRSYGRRHPEKSCFETSWEPIFVSDRKLRGTIDLCPAPFTRFSGSPLVRFKTTSYLENMFALRWAREQGFFDALFTNERGEITEGSIANIFFLKDGQISTPPVEAGLLPGITRKQVIQAARQLDMPLTESMVLPSGLKGFDGAFITNSLIEVLAVERIGDIRYETPDTIEKLHHAYRHRMDDFLFSR
jgi:branched-subunit amino acid aminotransferase/4-amino-4-deoxychorismate lyase